MSFLLSGRCIMFSADSLGAVLVLRGFKPSENMWESMECV
jgi:hypothetical protein